MINLNDNEVVLELLCSVIEATAPKVPLERVTLDASIDDLELDSLATMQMLGTLEERLQVEFPDGELVKLNTIGQVVALMRASQGRR
jgi:acyl carrier protein